MPRWTHQGKKDAKAPAAPLHFWSNPARKRINLDFHVQSWVRDSWESSPVGDGVEEGELSNPWGCVASRCGILNPRPQDPAKSPPPPQTAVLIYLPISGFAPPQTEERWRDLLQTRKEGTKIPRDNTNKDSWYSVQPCYRMWLEIIKLSWQE